MQKHTWNLPEKYGKTKFRCSALIVGYPYLMFLSGTEILINQVAYNILYVIESLRNVWP